MNEREIFEAALAIGDPDERSAFLESACADMAVREHIDGLIEAHEKLGSFLELPAAGLPATETRQPVKESLGTMIGPYKLLEQIGEGGMGVVYMAEQTSPIKMRVALKIIKPGMDSRQVIARFESERQALALMDHPNIARVLAAGTTDKGQPYFAMELVKGEPITAYCDKHHLTLRDRLELLASVCSAVQHAHQKGIIHRDLKPSNVLVARYDGCAVAKVIDFGVAKATGQQLTEKTLFTKYGQIVGTLEYMSPEQVEFNQKDVDTRSDIYSLGILFYELLTGTTPFDPERLRSGAWDEVMRIIREEEPPRPSVRVSTHQGKPSIAAQNCGAEPGKFLASLRGELDWLVMKALAKERERRYETASAFADDIRRYLDGEAVEAKPPSAIYRLRKTARRHRVVLATTATIMVSLCALSAISIWSAFTTSQARRATEIAMQREKKERRKAENALAYVRDYTMLMVMSGQEDDLRKALRIARAAEAPDVWRRLLTARSAMHRGDLDGAIAELEEGVREAPDNLACQGMLLYARIWLGYGDGLGEAIKAYRRRLEAKRSLSFEEMLFAGEALLINTREGIKWIDQALAMRDSDLARLIRSEMLARHAVEFDETARIDEALDDIRRVQQTFPESPYVVGESLKVHTLAMQALRKREEPYEHLQQDAEEAWRHLGSFPAYKAGKLWRAWYCDNFRQSDAELAWLDVLENGCGGWHKAHAAAVLIDKKMDCDVREFFEESDLLERFGLIGALYFQDLALDARSVYERHPHNGEPVYCVFGMHLDPLLVIGSRDEVRHEVSRLLSDRKQDFITPFDRSLTEFLADKADFEDVLAHCSNNSDRTMAHFVVARLRILEKRWGDAKEHLDETVELGVVHISDYYWAKRYLIRYADHFDR